MHSAKLRIFVAQLPQLLPANWATNSKVSELNGNNLTLAVVIDALRFTTTAAVALQAGAAAVSVAAEIDTARALATQMGPGTLLCGERHCHRIEGFHLGNSPLEYTTASVGTRNLVFSTTNGTLAVASAAAAQQVLLGSLTNRQAVASWIVSSGFSRIWFVCAGTDGQIAAEDVLTAGAITQACQQLADCELCNDSAIIAAEFFAQQASARNATTQSRISQLLAQAAGGRNLIEAGYESDLAEVAKLDSLTVVPHNHPNQSHIFKA